MNPMPPFDRLDGRRFSFFPAILNVEHNEWEYRQATWSEVLVVNAGTGEEIWIPRGYVGDISSSDEPVVIVGLNQELEHTAGGVWPHQRRVFEMPRVAGSENRERPAGSPVPVPAPVHRTANRAETRIGWLIGGALVLGLLACFVVVFAFRAGPTRVIHFASGDQDFLSLSRKDNYFDVVGKLGQPAEDRWRSEGGELQYRLLWYPRRAYYIVLIGNDRRDAHYIGALDHDWRVLHFVDLPAGGTTAAMLRELPKF
jgi:hypothetical protein